MLKKIEFILAGIRVKGKGDVKKEIKVGSENYRVVESGSETLDRRQYANITLASVSVF